MLISVIVPVYNSRQYLASCVDSILAQTYPNIEVILVDDGATDGSAEICDAYAERDSRVVVVHQENQGASAARNAGVAQAKGEWVTFVDSDDALEQDIYDTLLNLAKQYDADIVHCGYKRICADGTEKEVQGTGRLLVQTPNEAGECLLLGRYFTCGVWGKLYKKTLFTDVAFNTELKINEDILVNAMVFSRARKIVFTDVPKYLYFEREGSVCNSTDEIRKKRDGIRAAQSILELHKSDALTDLCENRLLSARVNMYRFLIMENDARRKDEQNDLRQRIQESLNRNSPSRVVWNYRFMRYLPGLYRFAYRQYDKIRKPNWDVN